jgi:hypothetical protein
MLGRGSPRLYMLLSEGAQNKKNLLHLLLQRHMEALRKVYMLVLSDLFWFFLMLFMCRFTVNTRANWNSMLEKTLVDLLHEHNMPEYKGNNGWIPHAWKKIAKKF